MKVTITVADGEAAVAVTAPTGAGPDPVPDGDAGTPAGGTPADPGAAVDGGGPPEWLTEAVGLARARGTAEGDDGTAARDAGGAAVGG
ncbi:hypothetical protein M1P56_27335 [Streptomyces sp. HU2014]|uniref:Uncharacterized protein n=1 Tax=Streptomyces albireticuli TaxID=1940 RepID=A0A1Z2L0F3_9ACTN|nr:MULTISPECIES: hypothetical protein [Streptomyces]ARZ67783.1 hypothetical protein SMD11_2131 [Streptomyces albireticuli]UQI47784.1 hypothetical protein M1P56_27335 [Streptomyces sp. HU2014]